MTEQIRFTSKGIEAIKPRDERFVVWDADRVGLGLRVTPRGTKAFIHAYRFDGRPRLHTIGNTKGMTLREALIAYAEGVAKIERAKLARGRGETPPLELDPAGSKRARRVATRDAETMSEVWAVFVAKKRVDWRPRTLAENERMWGAYLGELAGKRARDVRPRDVKVTLDKIAITAPVQANRVRALLAQIFHYAVGEFMVETSPVTPVRRVAKEAPRARALIEDADLRGFLAALAAPGWDAAVRDALMVTLATGTRPGEAGGMRWSEIDEASATWTIPAERAKTGLPHTVPLSEIPLEILAARRAAGSVGAFVFGDACKDVPLSSAQLSGPLRDRAKLLAKHDVAPLTPHDLRRTCRSWLSKLRVSEDVAERVIGHVKKNRLLKTYDRYDFLAEKRAALDLWGRTLIAMRAGDNVVALKGKTAA